MTIPVNVGETDYDAVTNRVNYDNPSGNLASPNFLRLTGYSTSTTPRLAQLGVRLGF